MAELLIVLALVLVNGFFAMSEMSVMTSRKSRLKQLAQSSRRAAKALALAEKPESFLSTVQIGITLIGILTGLFGGAAIGLCGLVVREGLPGPDIGFAFLPRFYGQGYAFEAASATLALARDAFALRKVLAIVSPDNARPIALLRRLGLRDAGSVRLPGKDEDILLFETAEDWRCATTSS